MAVFFLLLASLLLMGFLGLCGWISYEGRHEEVVRAQAIVVLGAAQWNGRPSPVLQARLDRGIELYRQGYAPLLIFTGGAMPGDGSTEASVGRDYALKQGVPETAILVEEQSRTTYENLLGARALLFPRGARSVLLVSDPFHMARSRIIARDLGFDPHPAPTHTSPIYREPLKVAGYTAREALALLSYLLFRR
ncbi:MAG: YdcF family protein [Chloroflexia bacterium]